MSVEGVESFQPAAPAAQTGRLARIVGGRTPLETRKAVWGYIFIAPWLIGLAVFILGPIVASLYLSFTSYDILGSPQWIGVENYRYAFFDDPLFWSSLGRTLYYALVMVPLSLAGSLGLALLLNQGLKGTSFFRTVFYIPYLTPAVAVAVIWVWLLHPALGPVNGFLEQIGLGGFSWLTSANTVIPSLILIGLWGSVGGTSMLVFLAGLQGVPQELQEAAEIDGAGMWTKFRNVTLPMLTPTILFNLVLGTIAAFQEFTVVFVATAGGPSYGSWLIGLHIYQQAFAYLRLGYGSALAWVLLVIILLITLVHFGTSRRWVFYQGD